MDELEALVATLKSQLADSAAARTAAKGAHDALALAQATALSADADVDTKHKALSDTADAIAAKVAEIKAAN